MIQDKPKTASPRKRDADYVFYELTRSICPDCRRVIDAHVLLKDNKVYMRSAVLSTARSSRSCTATRRRTSRAPG